MSLPAAINWSRIVLILASVVAVISLLCVISYSYQLNRDQKQNLLDARNNAHQEAEQISLEINDQLELIRPLVISLVDELNSGTITADQLPGKLEQVFRENPDSYILEVGIGFVVDPVTPANAPHFGFQKGTPDHFQVEQSYDYTQSAWYTSTMEHGSHWIRPYYGEATQAWTAGYAMRFYKEPEKINPAGVARINFRLDKVRQLVSSHRVGNTGYAFLYTADNSIIAHPIQEYIGQSMADLASDNAVLKSMISLADGKNSHEVRDDSTGQLYWVYSVPFQNSDWHVGVVFNEREALLSRSDMSNYSRAISLSLVMLAISVLLIVSRAYRGRKSTLWVFSVLSSVIFILGIGDTWYGHLNKPYALNPTDVRVVDKTSTEVIIANHRSDHKELLATDIVQIPTGIFVQSLRFTSANNVALTGYVWQRCFSNECLIEDLPGVIFPEAERLSIRDAYVGPQVKGWYFETTLRQQFNYGHYPFDREDVWVRLWPDNFRHFQGQVVLVPDFKSYKVSAAGLLPGLEKDFVLQGWETINSYFSYRKNPYNVNFGFEESDKTDKALELYFNIGMSRHFVSSFISDMIPIFVVSFLVFSVLMISTKDSDENELLGFSTSNVLGYCAALFFVVIISHVHLRETLATEGIIYLEYFYFLMYLLILITSTNSLLFASKTHIAIIDYKENLILKLLYWPVLMGGAFILTRMVF